MRIIHIVESMDPGAGGPPGVISRLAAAQAELLGEKGTVTVFSLNVPGREPEFARSIKGIPGIERVRFQPLPPGKMANWILPGETKRHLHDAIRNADIMHMHGVWDQLLWRAAKIARRKGVPYFITPHGMLDPWSLQQSRIKKALAMRLLFRSMLNGAARLHMLNDDESRLIEPLRLRPGVCVIPNGVFLNEIEPLPAQGTFRTSHPELQNDPFVLFLGRLHYKKGLDILAVAFATIAKRVDRVRLVVAGPDDGAQTDFEQRVQKFEHGADRVHVVGPIYGTAKFAALVDATCFCLPSRQEGFSVAITEALGCGVPVVITEGCHFPQVAEVGAGIIAPLDAQQIADGLLRVLGDAELRKRMSDAGRTLVRTQLTWPIIAKKSLEMYQMDRAS